MTKKLSPLLGYNTNIRHKNKLYHVQTEDSGLGHPHVITHAFADGGRIVATLKTSYQDWVAFDDVSKRVERLMKEQHQNMLRALRDGKYSEPPLNAELIETETLARDTIVTALEPIDDTLEPSAVQRALGSTTRLDRSDIYKGRAKPASGGLEKAVIDKSLAEVIDDLIEEEEHMLG